VPSMKSLHCIKHNGIPSAKRRRQLGTDVLSRFRQSLAKTAG
jgi:hypothetical protein